MVIDIFGWFGSILFAISAAPQAYLSYKNGHSDGVSSAMLWMWFTAEFFVLIYTIPKELWPLIANYICNILFVGTILWYKYNPHGNKG